MVVVYRGLFMVVLGGLVLVSGAAGQAVIQNEADGKSDINADFLDGFDRSAFLLASGDTLTGPLNANFYTVSNLAGPDDPRDAVPKKYVDTNGIGNLSKTLSINNKAGDNNINLSGNEITNVSRINGQLVEDLGTSSLSQVLDEGNEASRNLNMSNNRIVNLSDPQDPEDAATKEYVDTTDDVVEDDQDLQDVLGRGNNVGGEGIDFNESSGIRSDGQAALEFDQDQEVATPNGDLNLSGNNLTSGSEICAGNQCT